MFKQNIDCHNHLAEVYATSPDKALTWIKSANEKNIGFFMQGGIGPDNWEHQIQLKQLYPTQVGLCFGLHPYWVSENTEEQCEQALDKLSQYLVKYSKDKTTILALGEIGLDFRSQIVKDNEELQIRMLELQLEMIQWFKIPAVFHLVRAYSEAQKIINFWGDYTLKGMIHSFNGPSEQARYWAKKGFLLSIGGPVCHPANQKLHKSILEIPLNQLILETDSPDQPPPDYPKGENPPYSLWDVAKTIGKIRNLDAEEILDISNRNFQRVFGEVANGNESNT